MEEARYFGMEYLMFPKSLDRQTSLKYKRAVTKTLVGSLLSLFCCCLVSDFGFSRHKAVPFESACCPIKFLQSFL